MVPLWSWKATVPLEDGVTVQVPLAWIKWTETVSILLDCFCYVCNPHSLTILLFVPPLL